MAPAARAPDLVPVVLDGLRHRLGQVGDLMGVAHPQIRGLSEILPAPADALREMRDRLVRVIVPRQVRTRRPQLLARPTPAAAAGPAFRRLVPRLIIGARRHRRVPAVTRHQPLQPGDLLPQLPDQLVRSASTASSSSRDSCSYPATTQDHHIGDHHARTATPGPPDPEPASGRPSARQGRQPARVRPPHPPLRTAHRQVRRLQAAQGPLRVRGRQPCPPRYPGRGDKADPATWGSAWAIR
jgi:hypothetical protein